MLDDMPHSEKELLVAGDFSTIADLLTSTDSSSPAIGQQTFGLPLSVPHFELSSNCVMGDLLEPRLYPAFSNEYS